MLRLPVGEEVRSLQPLREFEILLIICAIVFLSLMLLGIGCSYYCLKKRNIRVVRRRPNSTLGSEVTKMSEPISMFGTLKIPRAHAEDTSGTEELTESVQSDFGSDVARYDYFHLESKLDSYPFFINVCMKQVLESKDRPKVFIDYLN